MLERLFKPTIKVAMVDGDGFIRRYKKYPIKPDGETIEITKAGGRGIPNPTFNEQCVLKKKNWFFKFWVPGVERFVCLRPGAKKCIEFLTKDDTPAVHLPDPDAIQEVAGMQIFSQWGSEKSESMLMYIAIGMMAINLLVTLTANGMIRLP